MNRRKSDGKYVHKDRPTTIYFIVKIVNLLRLSRTCNFEETSKSVPIGTEQVYRFIENQNARKYTYKVDVSLQMLYLGLKPIWRGNNVSFGSNVKLMRSLVISIFLYACKSWTLIAEIEKKHRPLR